jgi:hypothetical protein
MQLKMYNQGGGKNEGLDNLWLLNNWVHSVHCL